VNLIALPHTNDFVKLVKVEQQIDVSGEVDELIQETPHELRPLVLTLLTGKTQEQTAAEMNISRAEIWKMLSKVRPPVQPKAQPEKSPKVKELDKTDAHKAITRFMVECLDARMTCDQIAAEADKAGVRTPTGCKFAKRTVARWIQVRGLERTPRNKEIYDLVRSLMAQGKGAKSITSYLNAEGILTPTGKVWKKCHAESAMKVVRGTKRRHVSEVGEK